MTEKEKEKLPFSTEDIILILGALFFFIFCLFIIALIFANTILNITELDTWKQ